ncbi:MAG: hypothetical protein ABIP14_13600, partial [Blastocatellia bacterium]
MIKVKVYGDDNDGAPEKPVKKTKRNVSGKQPALMVIIPKGSKAARGNDNRPRMPNPWPPTDIVPLLKMACIVPVAKAVLELIKLW